MYKKLSCVLVVLMTVFFFSCSNKDEVDIRDQFVSTYQVTDSWSVNGAAKTYSYSMVITKSAQDSRVILLSNFGGRSDVIIKAEVSGNRFTIQQQTAAQDLGYSGSGSVSGSTLSFSYLVSINGSGAVNATSTGTKM